MHMNIGTFLNFSLNQYFFWILLLLKPYVIQGGFTPWTPCGLIYWSHFRQIFFLVWKTIKNVRMKYDKNPYDFPRKLSGCLQECFSALYYICVFKNSRKIGKRSNWKYSQVGGSTNLHNICEKAYRVHIHTPSWGKTRLYIMTYFNFIFKFCERGHLICTQNQRGAPYFVPKCGGGGQICIESFPKILTTPLVINY